MMIAEREMTDYQAFLEQKRITAPTCGFEVSADELNPLLFEWQRRAVAWALKRGRAALFQDCGLGKTVQQLEWALWTRTQTELPALVVAPLGVNAQTIREGHKFGIPSFAVRCQEDVRDGINVTNYEMLPKFDPTAFGALVLDECFPPDTPVLSAGVDGVFGYKYIESIREGDLILNAFGVDRVADVHRREIQYAVQVHCGVRSFTCSPNHPCFTQRGWVGAQDLVPGDHLMETAEALRLVREGVHGKEHAGKVPEVLREILFSELADAAAGTPGEGSQSGDGREAREFPVGLVCCGQPQGRGAEGAYQGAKSSQPARGSREDLPPVERDEARTFRAWGERAWFDGAAADLDDCSGIRMASGICFVIGETHSRLSHSLQDRHRKRQSENRYRSGWSLARSDSEEASGHQENGETAFARVDCLEVLEPGDPRLERYRSEDGCIYFYDLGATRHPSYTVNGFLVHNSSILKGNGPLRKSISEFAAPIPFRLACTATPAPNDTEELINHSEFLGIRNGNETLAEFFTQDGNSTHKWKLKDHARKAFWQWLASWALALRKPSDIGGDDSGFILPPAEYFQHIVEAPLPGDALFQAEARGIRDQRKVRKETLAERVERVVALANSDEEPWVIWCDLNDESKALTKGIRGAVEVTGTMKPDDKTERLLGFVDGKYRVLVSKPEIAGFGLNFQHCRNAAFVGLGNSYEKYYQAIRRNWRFGQERQVRIHVVISEADGPIVRNIQRKEEQAAEMMDQLVAETRALTGIEGAAREDMEYRPCKPMVIPSWIKGNA